MVGYTIPVVSIYAGQHVHKYHSDYVVIIILIASMCSWCGYSHMFYSSQLWCKPNELFKPNKVVLFTLLMYFLHLLYKSCEMHTNNNNHIKGEWTCLDNKHVCIKENEHVWIAQNTSITCTQVHDMNIFCIHLYQGNLYGW